MSVETWAFIIAVATMIAMAVLGVAYARGRTVTLEDFVSARGTAGGFTSMATAVASVMGAWILFSPAEAATWAGLAGIIGYGIGQAAPIAAFMVLGPRLRRLMPHGHSLTEFVWFRFGRLMYVMALGIVVLYMFTFLAAEMGAIARAVKLVTDAPLLVTLVLVAAATLAYTVLGGLRVSIFTDNVQFLLILPLLVLVMAAAISELGGWSGAFDPVRDANPALLDLGHQPGIEFGITLIIAILAANLFHQGFWQRAYAAKTDADFRNGFLVATVLAVPMVIGVGLFGLWAVGQGLVTEANPASIALFTLALDILPGWVLVVLTALALVLVMSSMDTLLNGITSVFTSDLPRANPTFRGAKLLRSSRLITAALIVPAMAVGFAFDSVLYLFLIADLVTAGAMVPVFVGMYTGRLGGRGAAVSTALGIASGAVFFPTKSLAGWWTWQPLTDLWHVLASGNLLGSFFMAVAVSTAAVLVAMAFERWRHPASRYDLADLSARVDLLEESA